MKKPSALLAIFLIVLVDILGLTIVIPLLPFYAEKFGGSPRVYGMLVTSFALCQLFSGPLLGKLSDRTGRKPLLIVSQMGTFIGFIVLARAQSLAMIFVSRIIDGSTAGNLSLAQAYISDVTTPQNRAKAFGLIGIAFGLGFLVGPALSGYLSQYGYQYPAYAAASLSMLSILGTTFLLPSAKHEKPMSEKTKVKTALSLLQWKSYVKYFHDPKISPLLIQFFLFSIGFSMYISGFALFAERRFEISGRPFGPKEVGYLMAYSGLLGILIQGGILGRLVKKFGEPRLVTTGFLSMAIGYISTGFVHSVGVLMVMMTFSAFGTGLLRPTLTSLITQNTGRDEQGSVLGLNQTLMSIAQILAPLLTGFLIGQSQLTLWAAVAGMSGVIGVMFTTRQTRPRRTARS